MDLAKVMDELGARLNTIDGLRAQEWPPGGAFSPPAAFVGYPERIEFDMTYQRGSDVYRRLPVLIALPRPNERQTRDLMAMYCAGSGPKSIKAVLESGAYTACDTVVVVEIEMDGVTIGATPCLVAACLCDIVGEGDPI
jgi:hypothetical protein